MATFVWTQILSFTGCSLTRYLYGLTVRHATLGRTLNEISARDNTQHTQGTDIHAPGGLRTRNYSRRAAAGVGVIGCWSWKFPESIYRVWVKLVTLRWKYSVTILECYIVTNMYSVWEVCKLSSLKSIQFTVFSCPAPPPTDYKLLPYQHTSAGISTVGK